MCELEKDIRKVYETLAFDSENIVSVEENVIQPNVYLTIQTTKDSFISPTYFQALERRGFYCRGISKKEDGINIYIGKEV